MLTPPTHLSFAHTLYSLLKSIRNLAHLARAVPALTFPLCLCFGGTGPDSWQVDPSYLTVEQALADYAALLWHLK